MRAANANDFAAARAAFLKYFPFFRSIFLDPNPVPVKYALKQAGIIESDEVRLPLGQISGEARAILDPLMLELELT